MRNMNHPYPSAPPKQPPPEFVCPISLEVMRQPVLCEDGHTYERSVILQWLATSPTSPTTRQPMSPTNIRPNYALKSAIERWSQIAPRRVLPPPPSIQPRPSNTTQSFFSVPFSYQPQQTYNGYIVIPVASASQPSASQPSTPILPLVRRRVRPHIIPCLLYLIIIGVFIFMGIEGIFG